MFPNWQWTIITHKKTCLLCIFCLLNFSIVLLNFCLDNHNTVTFIVFLPWWWEFMFPSSAYMVSRNKQRNVICLFISMSMSLVLPSITVLRKNFIAFIIIKKDDFGMNEKDHWITFQWKAKGSTESWLYYTMQFQRCVLTSHKLTGAQNGCHRNLN